MMYHNDSINRVSHSVPAAGEEKGEIPSPPPNETGFSLPRGRIGGGGLRTVNSVHKIVKCSRGERGRDGKERITDQEHKPRWMCQGALSSPTFRDNSFVLVEDPVERFCERTYAFAYATLQPRVRSGVGVSATDTDCTVASATHKCIMYQRATLRGRTQKGGASKVFRKEPTESRCRILRAFQQRHS